MVAGIALRLGKRSHVLVFPLWLSIQYHPKYGLTTIDNSFKKIICLAKSVVDLRHRLQRRSELKGNHRNCSGTQQDCSHQIASSLLGYCQFFLWWRKHRETHHWAPWVPSIVCSLDLWKHLSQLFLSSGRKSLRWENNCCHWGHCSKPTLCFGLTFTRTKSLSSGLIPLLEMYLEGASFIVKLLSCF